MPVSHNVYYSAGTMSNDSKFPPPGSYAVVMLYDANDRNNIKFTIRSDIQRFLQGRIQIEANGNPPVDYKVHSYTLGFRLLHEARLHKDKLKELRNFTSLPLGSGKLRLMHTYTIDVVSRDQDLYAGDITVSKIEEGWP